MRGEDAQMLTCGGELWCLHHCCLRLCCACAQMLMCRLLFRAGLRWSSCGPQMVALAPIWCNVTGARKGCGVAKFCSAECQKMASHIGTEGVEVGSARHKDICGLLKKWRQVQKGREAADSCTADMLAFLRL